MLSQVPHLFKHVEDVVSIFSIVDADEEDAFVSRLLFHISYSDVYKDKNSTRGNLSIQIPMEIPVADLKKIVLFQRAGDLPLEKHIFMLFPQNDPHKKNHIVKSGR